MVRTTASTTSLASWALRSRCWPPLALGRRGSKSAPRSSTCATNPFYMAEDAGAADLLAGGRLQLGISRGSPEQVIDGWRYFGYQPAEEDDAEMARRHAEVFLELLKGEVRQAESAADVPEPAGPAAHRAPFARTPRADLVGRGITDDRCVGGRHGHESDELDAGLRRCERRPLPRHASASHPRLPRGVARRLAMSVTHASPSAGASSHS